MSAHRPLFYRIDCCNRDIRQILPEVARFVGAAWLSRLLMTKPARPAANFTGCQGICLQGLDDENPGLGCLPMAPALSRNGGAEKLTDAVLGAWPSVLNDHPRSIVSHS